MKINYTTDINGYCITKCPYKERRNGGNRGKIILVGSYDCLCRCASNCGSNTTLDGIKYVICSKTKSI